MKLLSLITLIAIVLLAAADKARFDNYRVYSTSIDSKLQLRVLKELAEISDSVSLKSFKLEIAQSSWAICLQYDFWDSPNKVGSSVDVVVPPHKFADFGEIVERYKFQTTLTTKNLQEWDKLKIANLSGFT